MDLDTYTELTGNVVDPEDIVAVTAQIRQCKSILEGMLGYTLDKKKAGINQYFEKGIAKVQCPFRGLISDLSNLELDPPDDVIGSYRLFPYNKSDKLFEVDPFTKLYKVKLVFLQSGDIDDNGITHKVFSDGKIRIHKTGNVSKYIERCNECICTCNCDNCVQLAIDADWLNESCLPEELMYVWAEMVENYVDPSRDILEETLGTHRYKRAESKPVETLDETLKIISKYAGPNGSVNQTITV